MLIDDDMMSGGPAVGEGAGEAVQSEGAAPISESLSPPESVPTPESAPAERVAPQRRAARARRAPDAKRPAEDWAAMPQAARERAALRAIKKEFVKQRREAVAKFVADLEGRLARAESDACFAREDWDRIRHTLLPRQHACPDADGLVRIPEEEWETLCDLLLTAEREKVQAALAGTIPFSDKHGPDRYLYHRTFDAAAFQRLLRLVLPELFTRPKPERPSQGVEESPGMPGKVQLMMDRFERGEDLHHPEDSSNVGGRVALDDRVALFYAMAGGEKRPAYDGDRMVTPDIVGADFLGRQLEPSPPEVIRLSTEDDVPETEILRGKWSARDGGEDADESGGRRARTAAGDCMIRGEGYRGE